MDDITMDTELSLVEIKSQVMIDFMSKCVKKDNAYPTDCSVEQWFKHYFEPEVQLTDIGSVLTNIESSPINPTESGKLDSPSLNLKWNRCEDLASKDSIISNSLPNVSVYNNMDIQNLHNTFDKKDTECNTPVVQETLGNLTLPERSQNSCSNKSANQKPLANTDIQTEYMIPCDPDQKQTQMPLVFAADNKIGDVVRGKLQQNNTNPGDLRKDNSIIPQKKEGYPVNPNIVDVNDFQQQEHQNNIGNGDAWTPERHPGKTPDTILFSSRELEGLDISIQSMLPHNADDKEILNVSEELEAIPEFVIHTDNALGEQFATDEGVANSTSCINIANQQVVDILDGFESTSGGMTLVISERKNGEESNSSSSKNIKDAVVNFGNEKSMLNLTTANFHVLDSLEEANGQGTVNNIMSNKTENTKISVKAQIHCNFPCESNIGCNNQSDVLSNTDDLKALKCILDNRKQMFPGDAPYIEVNCDRDNSPSKSHIAKKRKLLVNTTDTQNNNESDALSSKHLKIVKGNSRAESPEISLPERLVQESTKHNWLLNKCSIDQPDNRVKSTSCSTRIPQKHRVIDAPELAMEWSDNDGNALLENYKTSEHSLMMPILIPVNAISNLAVPKPIPQPAPVTTSKTTLSQIESSHPISSISNSEFDQSVMINPMQNANTQHIQGRQYSPAEFNIINQQQYLESNPNVAIHKDNPIVTTKEMILSQIDSSHSLNAVPNAGLAQSVVINTENAVVATQIIPAPQIPSPQLHVINQPQFSEMNAYNSAISTSTNNTIHRTVNYCSVHSTNLLPPLSPALPFTHPGTNHNKSPNPIRNMIPSLQHEVITTNNSLKPTACIMPMPSSRNMQSSNELLISNAANAMESPPVMTNITARTIGTLTLPQTLTGDSTILQSSVTEEQISYAQHLKNMVEAYLKLESMFKKIRQLEKDKTTELLQISCRKQQAIHKLQEITTKLRCAYIKDASDKKTTAHNSVLSQGVDQMEFFEEADGLVLDLSHKTSVENFALHEPDRKDESETSNKVPEVKHKLNHEPTMKNLIVEKSHQNIGDPVIVVRETNYNDKEDHSKDISPEKVIEIADEDDVENDRANTLQFVDEIVEQIVDNVAIASGEQQLFSLGSKDQICNNSNKVQQTITNTQDITEREGKQEKTDECRMSDSIDRQSEPDNKEERVQLSLNSAISFANKYKLERKKWDKEQYRQFIKNSVYKNIPVKDHQNNIHLIKIDESKQFEAGPECSIQQNNQDIIASHYDMQSEQAQGVSKKVLSAITSDHLSYTHKIRVSDELHTNPPQTSLQATEYVGKSGNQHTLNFKIPQPEHISLTNQQLAEINLHLSLKPKATQGNIAKQILNHRIRTQMAAIISAHSSVLHPQAVQHPHLTQLSPPVLHPQLVQHPQSVHNPQSVHIPMSVQLPQSFQRPQSVLLPQLVQHYQSLQQPQSVQHPSIVHKPRPLKTGRSIVCDDYRSKHIHTSCRHEKSNQYQISNKDTVNDINHLDSAQGNQEMMQHSFIDVNKEIMKQNSPKYHQYNPNPSLKHCATNAETKSDTIISPPNRSSALVNDVHDVMSDGKKLNGFLKCSTCCKEARFGCSGCKNVVYCSAKCQNEAWPMHIKECLK